jgi:hypothetical protein
LLSIKKLGIVLWTERLRAGGLLIPAVAQARLITKAIIAAIVRGLRSGKSPKEIAMMTGETHENVRVIIHRYREVHAIFVATYHKRNPHKESVPPKMANSIREV